MNSKQIIRSFRLALEPSCRRQNARQTQVAAGVKLIDGGQAGAACYIESAALVAAGHWRGIRPSEPPANEPAEAREAIITRHVRPSTGPLRNNAAAAG